MKNYVAGTVLGTKWTEMKKQMRQLPSQGLLLVGLKIYCHPACSTHSGSLTGPCWLERAWGLVTPDDFQGNASWSEKR